MYIVAERAEKHDYKGYRYREREREHYEKNNGKMIEEMNGR